jgi:hypothetical protein
MHPTFAALTVNPSPALGEGFTVRAVRVLSVNQPSLSGYPSLKTSSKDWSLPLTFEKN